jgi:hypothetical protein
MPCRLDHSDSTERDAWAEAPKEGVLVNLDIFTPLRPEYAEFTGYQTDEFTQNTAI